MRLQVGVRYCPETVRAEDQQGALTVWSCTDLAASETKKHVKVNVLEAVQT